MKISIYMLLLLAVASVIAAYAAFGLYPSLLYVVYIMVCAMYYWDMYKKERDRYYAEKLKATQRTSRDASKASSTH